MTSSLITLEPPTPENHSNDTGSSTSSNVVKSHMKSIFCLDSMQIDTESQSKRISTHGPRGSRREEWRKSKGLAPRPASRGMNRQGLVAGRRKSGRSKRRRWTSRYTLAFYVPPVCSSCVFSEISKFECYMFDPCSLIRNSSLTCCFSFRVLIDDLVHVLRFYTVEGSYL